MVEKYIGLGEVAHSETDLIIHVWCFTCSRCQKERWAYIHESGVVLDIEEGQPYDIASIQVEDNGVARNLYQVINAGANLKAGSQALVHQDIADLHAQAFHNEPRAEVGLAH